MSEGSHDLAARLDALETAVAALQQRIGDRIAEAPSESSGDGTGDEFWALNGLESRHRDAVVLAGSLDIPDAGPVRWQQGLTAEALAAANWSELAPTLDALAHPVRLSILQLVFTGTRSTSELTAAGDGTTGQLHHHLRQLVAAGWLTATRRGHYEIPPQRIVPLLITLLAATR